MNYKIGDKVKIDDINDGYNKKIGIITHIPDTSKTGKTQTYRITFNDKHSTYYYACQFKNNAICELLQLQYDYKAMCESIEYEPKGINEKVL